MSNLTITIDDGLLRAARIKAVQQGTSVNEVCRQAIAAFVWGDPVLATAQAHARARAFVELSEQMRVAGLGNGGSTNNAEALPATAQRSRPTRYPTENKPTKPADSPQRGAKS
jgi:hypothetical protein